MSNIAIFWFRRNLRLNDNKVLAAALKNSNKIIPIFIFDDNILRRFTNPKDRRLSFLATRLLYLNQLLDEKLLIFKGDSTVILPKIASIMSAQSTFADKAFEKTDIIRDRKVEANCNGDFNLVCDHLLFEPGKILNKSKQPFKVFTPYMHELRRSIRDEHLTEYENDYNGRIYVGKNHDLREIGLIDHQNSHIHLLKQIGYEYVHDDLWKVDEGDIRLDNFFNNKVISYDQTRNMLDFDGTSALSPYIRFGLISIRECYRRALNVNTVGAEIWLRELIWREFYADVMYQYPFTASEEYQAKYRGALPWNQKGDLYDRFIKAETGYPIIDAAVRQLLNDGWMHNRARMITASFFTKNLFLNWRLGEEFFAQYLMDYEVASNVGGWQWAASCGINYQAYFRPFSVFEQSRKCDPDALYIKKYLPKLNDVSASSLHSKKQIESGLVSKDRPYPLPVVDYELSRNHAISVFKIFNKVSLT